MLPTKSLIFSRGPKFCLVIFTYFWEGSNDAVNVVGHFEGFPENDTVDVRNPKKPPGTVLKPCK